MLPVTRFAPLYRSFRELLDYEHRHNLASHLKNLHREGRMAQRRLQEVIVEPPLEAGIYFYLRDDELWLLAGYWVRKGEPSEVLRRTVERYVADLALGKDIG